MANTQTTEALLTAKAVGGLLSVSKRQVFRMRSAGLICPPVKVGQGAIRWRQSDIEQLTPFLTPTAFSGCNPFATIGNEQSNSEGEDAFANAINSGHLGKQSDRLATVGVGVDSKTPVPEDNGGGGNRTRVPRHFSKGIYARS